MSQSNSLTSVDTTSTSTIEIGLRRSSIAASRPAANSPYSHANKTKDYLHQPKPQQPPVPLSSGHYETLQEHAGSVLQGECTDLDAVTPRHDVRRESCAWGLRIAHEEETPEHSRNPMMPERRDNTTPPSMEELVRRTTSDDDTSSTRRSSIMHIDTVVSHSSTRRSSTTRSSTPGTDIESLTRSDTRRSSIGGLARSMTRRLPDIRPQYVPVEGSSNKKVKQSEEEPEVALSAQSGKKPRKLSFQLPSGLKMKNSPELLHKPSPVVEESPVCETSAKADSQNTPPKYGSLAERRKVKLDLTLPIDLPGLSSRHKSLAGDVMNSITPSRPRSPKTPWIGNQQPNWGHDTTSKPAKPALIVEEDQTYLDVMAQITSEGRGSMPVSEPASILAPSPLVTPDFVRPPQKFRDRCYISRPALKRNKSGGPSTSESDFGSTPDGHWTPDIKEGMTEQEVRRQGELGELAKASKNARARRWPWSRSKASGSDEQVQDERSNSRMNISANIFRRSNRLPESLEKEQRDEKEKKDKKTSKGLNPPWRREKSTDRPPLPSASLANMPLPPTFVPPGCEKVTTPPTFDAASEVRGKLADFFFESGGFSSARRKPKSSSGGYWDSDAVLMSMQTDINLTDDENDEEGPEGRPPVAFHFGPVNDTPGLMTSPGFVTGPEGYLTVKGFSPGVTPLSPSTAQDSWFRMHYGDHAPDEESLTSTALKEADERRKFEWLVPEHLPNSPLCPLHAKYVGPSKGLCYWHGRKSNGWGVELGRDYISQPITIGRGISAGWNTGRMDTPKVEKKKRRLQSLSSS